MPQRRRRGAAGGAQQGLAALSQILASLLQNRMGGQRQQEYLEAIGQQQTGRDEANALRQQQAAELAFQRQLALENARQQVAGMNSQRQEAAGLAEQVTSGDPGRKAVMAQMNMGNPMAREAYQAAFQPAPMDPNVPGATVKQQAPPLPPPFRSEAQKVVETAGTPGYLGAVSDIARAGRRTPEEVRMDEQASAEGRAAGTPLTPSKPTQAQVDAGARLPLLLAAERQASAIEKAGSERGDMGSIVFQSNLPDWANFMRGNEGQKYRTSVRAVGITSLKTLFPGQLSDQEREAGLALIVPQPFDTPEERQFKSQMRRGLIQIVQSIAEGGAVDPQVLANILSAFQNPEEALQEGLQGGAPTEAAGPDPYVQELIRRGLQLPGGGR